MVFKEKELWIEMYKAAERVRDLKAWQWMEEDDLFAVVNPQNENEIGFCSMIGSMGKFTALAIYKGWEGYESFLQLRNSAGIENRTYMINVGFLQSCWMIEFTNAAEMQRSSKNQLKELGIKYKGAGNWVDITDRRPGLLPWYVSEKDVPFVTICINQFFEIALRAEENPAFLHQPNPNYDESIFSEDDLEELENDTLVIFRKANAKSDGKWDWYDEPTDIEQLMGMVGFSERIVPSIAAVSTKRQLQTLDTCLMIGMMVIPAPIQEEDEEAPFLTILMVYLLYGERQIIRQELYRYEEIKPDFERVLLEVLRTLNYVPSQILVNMDLSASWLDSYADLFDFDVFVDPEDENFDDCFGELGHFYQNIP